MFNLETAIAEWRRQMRATGIKTPVPLEELENHLREDFDAQVRGGAAPERAFELAASRLGSPAAIQQEFRKVGECFPAWARKLNYTVCAVVSVAGCAVGLNILFYILHPRGAHAPLGERVSVAGALFASMLLLSSWMFLWRFLPALPVKHISRASLAGLVLGVVCTDILLRFLPLGTGTMVELAIAVAWALVPLWAACAFIFGLEEAAYRSAHRRPMKGTHV